MDGNYDTFSYPDDPDDNFYEPVLENDISAVPSVPPRNPISFRGPQGTTRALPDPPLQSSVPKLPWSQPRSFHKVSQYYAFKRPHRSMMKGPSPILDASKRAPLPIHDGVGRGKMSIPEVPQRVPPRPPPAIPGEEAPELNYEDLESYDGRAIPPIPDTSPRMVGRGPQLDFGRKFMTNIPDKDDISNQVNVNILTAARKNLGKRNRNVETRSQIENPKPQFSFTPEVNPKALPELPPQIPNRPEISSKPPIRPEIPPKPPIRPEVPPKTPFRPEVLPQTPTRLETTHQSSLKRPIPSKPQLSVKPTISELEDKKLSNISDKIAAMNLDSTDRGHNITPEKKSPSNSLKRKDLNQTPEKNPLGNSLNETKLVHPSMKVSPRNTFTGDFSEEDSDSQEEYADASEIISLHFQPYYRETFDKTLEDEFFKTHTENGSFVIRKSRVKTQNSNHPYTLLVFFGTRVYRLKIRLEDDMYAIGERKADENKFDSVIELVNYYSKTPLMLIGAGYTTLKVPIETL